MPAKRLNFPLLAQPKRSSHLAVVTSDKLDLVLTTSPITLPAGHVDVHPQYEFFIPLTPVSQFFVGPRQISCQPGSLVPVSPGQQHGIREGRKLISFISLFIEHEWLDRLMRKIKGAGHSGFPAEALDMEPDVQNLITQMIGENMKETPCREFLLRSLAEQLAILIIRHYCRTATSPELINPDLLAGEQRRFQAVISLMQHQYAYPLTIKQLADMAGMNNYYFIRIFKRLFSVSPYHMLMRIRLANAKRLLARSDLMICEISRKCGFKSASRFSAVFLKETGQTPSHFRRNVAE
jgi:AraC-like DNA-binding protein